MTKAKVYFTKEITPQSLIAIYKALGVELSGRVGVKSPPASRADTTTSTRS